MPGSIQRSLKSRATTRRKARVSDGQGGWTETYADYLMNRPCRRRPADDAERESADQEQATVDHIVYFLPGDDVRRGDQVVVDGYELLVLNIIVPSRPRYAAAACQQTQLGA